MRCENCKMGKIPEKAIEIAEKYKNEDGGIMSALHEVQDYFGYISEDIQKYFSKIFEIPVSEIYGIVTFYSRFSLIPKGKYNIEVCMGTACYVKGSEKVYEKFKQILKIEDGQTTKDGLFSLSKVRCIGACGLAPAICINGEVYGKVTEKMVEELIKKYSEN